MKKNQKKFKKNKGIKKQMENIIDKEVKNIIASILIFFAILIIIAGVGAIVNILTNIITMKMIFFAIAIIIIALIIYIIK